MIAKTMMIAVMIAVIAVIVPDQRAVREPRLQRRISARPCVPDFHGPGWARDPESSPSRPNSEPRLCFNGENKK
jgi:hypothetical protein